MEHDDNSNTMFNAGQLIQVFKMYMNCITSLAVNTFYESTTRICTILTPGNIDISENNTSKRVYLFETTSDVSRFDK